MRKLLFLVMLTFSLPLLRAQSVEEIQNSKEYIWGTGNASTLKKADNEALAALISQISTNVSSQFSQLTEGGTDGDKATVDETFKSVINTYSRATLNNTRRIVIQNEPEAAVMRYIKVSEIQRIFEGRKPVRLTQKTEKSREKGTGSRCPTLLLLGSYLAAKLSGRQFPHHERRRRQRAITMQLDSQTNE